MADNSTLPVSGGGTEVFANDDIGSVKYPRVKATWGPDGTANDVDVATGKLFPVQLRSSTGLEVTKLEDAASGDGHSGVPMMAVRDNAPANTSDTNGDYEFARILNGLLLTRADTKYVNVDGSTLTRPANATPYTANDSISDNGTAGSVTANTVTISDLNDNPVELTEVRLDSSDTGVASAIIRIHIFNSDPTASTGVVAGDNVAYSNKKAGWVGSMSGTMRTFSDGSRGRLVPDEGGSIIMDPGSGAKTLWYQLQTLSAFTPSANSTTFVPRFKGYQGRP